MPQHIVCNCRDKRNVEKSQRSEYGKRELEGQNLNIFEALAKWVMNIEVSNVREP